MGVSVCGFGLLCVGGVSVVVVVCVAPPAVCVNAAVPNPIGLGARERCPGLDDPGG